MVEGDVSHDRITRFLSKQEYTSRDLWRQVKAMFRQVEDARGVLIFERGETASGLQRPHLRP